MIIPETARQMASAIPDSTLVELRPAGHMSIFEQHAELFETLARFASGVAGGVR